MYNQVSPLDFEEKDVHLKNYWALEALIVRFDQMFGGVSVAHLSIFLCGVALRCAVICFVYFFSSSFLFFFAFLLPASCVLHVAGDFVIGISVFSIVYLYHPSNTRERKYYHFDSAVF